MFDTDYIKDLFFYRKRSLVFEGLWRTSYGEEVPFHSSSTRKPLKIKLSIHGWHMDSVFAHAALIDETEKIKMFADE